MTGLESPMYGALRFTVQKGRTILSPQYQTPPGSLTRAVDGGAWYGTTGVGGDLYVAAQDAVRSMVAHISETYDMPGEEAYMLSSLCVDLKISEIVDAGEWIVSALLPEAVFTSA